MDATKGTTASTMGPRNSLKTTLKKKYKKVMEALSDKSLLPPRLCFHDFESDNPFNNLGQHEFRFVDRSDLHSWIVYETVPLEKILYCDCKHDKSKRIIMTCGVSGVGKTTVVQSCAVEWAKGERYQDIRLLFPLMFWELNLLKNKLSLAQLLQTFYPEVRTLQENDLNQKDVWFILDGLDECNFEMYFSCPTVRHVSEPATVDILIANLIRGNLLPNAHIWVTTRHSASGRIPRFFFLKETEINGFSDEQKEQHFKTIIGNDDLAYKAIDHVKISRSLDFLCEIPPICTIMANVLKQHVKADDGFKIKPLNLTQMYSNLFKTSNPTMMGKLKKVAMRWMGERNVFSNCELKQCNISVEEASAFCKECPLVLREEKGLHNTTVFRFCHSSILEFLAASATLDYINAKSGRSTRCQKLVEAALESQEGKSDVFLRFIFGLIKERNMFAPKDPLFLFMKRKILDNILNYSAVALFHSLREYDSQALLDEVKVFQKNRISPIPEFTPMHWHIMVQRSTNFEGMRNKFEMEVTKRCDERVVRQITAILKSKKAMLRFSNLTDQCCPALAAVLSTKESYLRELDLGYNSIKDVGVMNLVEGLSDQNCRLKGLRLQACELSPKACKYLAKALTESPKLQMLDLSMNEFGNEGLQHLADGLGSEECFLKTLKLSQCRIEEEGCGYLGSALQRNPDHLKELDLSINMVGDKGGNKLFKRFNISQLTKLEMYHCCLTELSCATIGEALTGETSSLVELNLSNNNLKDVGFTVICKEMYKWSCLEKLNVSRCGITDASCPYLAKVLGSVSQPFSGCTIKGDWQAVELMELDLSKNRIGDKGVIDMLAGMKNPYGHLKALNLSNCSLTEDCCKELAAVLVSQSAINELDLSHNQLRDEGVKKLCEGLKSPQCKLEKLSLRSCGFSMKGIYFLITALKSNPKHLTELHLLGNNLQESAICLLEELTDNATYTLHTSDLIPAPNVTQETFPLPPYFSED